MPASYNARTTPLAQNATNPLAASMRLAYDFTGHDTRSLWQPYDWVGATQPTVPQLQVINAVTRNGIPGRQVSNGSIAGRYGNATDFGLQVGSGDYTACVLFSTGSAVPSTSGGVNFFSVCEDGFNTIASAAVFHDSSGWICQPQTAGATVSPGTQGRTYVGANKTVAMFIRRVSGTCSAWRVILGDDASAQRITDDSTTAASAVGTFTGTTAKTLDLFFSGSDFANTPGLHSFRFHNAGFSEAEMLSYANAWWELDEFTAPPVITGPTGAAGAASITHTALENQNAAGTWTASGTGSWSLTGADAGLLSISGGVVTLASGSFNFEAKASYSFNVVYGSASQAVTLNISNLPELSTPTKTTPTSTTAIIGATVDGTSGTLFGVLTLDNSAPSGTQIEAGQNSAGSSATVIACTPLTITSAGAKSLAAATVVSGTTRYGWLVYKIGSVYSTVLATGPLYPGTGRPALGVTASGGWTASTGTDLGAMLNEDTADDATYITTPTLTSTNQDRDFPLTQSFPPGTYSNLRFRARCPSGSATARISLLSAAGVVLATSGDQAMGGTFTTFTLASVTLADTATQLRLSAKSP
jgi:hypothetical protein